MIAPIESTYQANSFLTTPSTTDSLMTTPEQIQQVILNIDDWIKLGTLDTLLAESINDALAKLARLHIARQLAINKKFNSSKLEYYLTTLEENIETVLSQWDETGYSEIVQGIFGKTAAGVKVKNGKEYNLSVRDEIVATMANTAQCEAAMITNQNYNPNECWICEYGLQDYKPNGAFRVGKNGTHENICPPNAIDCEHILGIKLALQHLNLVQISKKLYKQNPISYREILNLEYDLSHKCCNMIKLEIGFIKKGDNGLYEVDTDAIRGVLDNIYKDALVNRQKAYGCACIGMDQGGVTRVNQKENRIRVIGRVQEIANVINGQINHIKAIIQQNNPNNAITILQAAEVYEAFIKYRFLTRIPASKLINAMVNCADTVTLPPNYLVKGITKGGGENKISESNQFGGTGVLSETSFGNQLISIFNTHANLVDLKLIWILNNISYENIEYFEENGLFAAEHNEEFTLMLSFINSQIESAGYDEPIEQQPVESAIHENYRVRELRSTMGKLPIKYVDNANGVRTFTIGTVEIILDPPNYHFSRDGGRTVDTSALYQDNMGNYGVKVDDIFYKFYDNKGTFVAFGGAKKKKNRKQNKNKTQKIKNKNTHIKKNKTIHKRIK